MDQVHKAIPVPGSLQEVVWDVGAGVRSWRLWAFMGLLDIRQRYRRSSFGPLWVALGLGVTILGIGLLYSTILKTNAASFVPFLAISLLAWQYLSSVISESAGLFQNAAGLISSMRIPYTTIVLRAITRNLIVFAHCIAPVIIAYIIYRYPVHLVALAAIPGLILLTLNLWWMGLAIALVCVRFRDVQQIVIYAMQLAIFVTPIIWQPTQIRAGSPTVLYNPLYHLIELIRAPIFEGKFPLGSYMFCGAFLVVGTVVTLFAFSRVRRKIIYWL